MPRFVDLLCGRVTAVTVRVVQRDIPAELIGGDPLGDAGYRKQLGAWAEQQWHEKDALIDRLMAPVTGSTAPVEAATGVNRAVHRH